MKRENLFDKSFVWKEFRDIGVWHNDKLVCKWLWNIVIKCCKKMLQATIILDRLTFPISILYYYLFLLKLDMTLIYCKLSMESNWRGLNWPQECHILFDWPLIKVTSSLKLWCHLLLLFNLLLFALKLQRT